MPRNSSGWPSGAMNVLPLVVTYGDGGGDGGTVAAAAGAGWQRGDDGGKREGS